MPYPRQRQLQGQGFYNPSMPGPDYGAGISQFFNQMVQLKEGRRQQEEEQSRYEREFDLKQQQAGREEKRLDAYVKSLTGGKGKTLSAKDQMMLDAVLGDPKLTPDQKKKWLQEWKFEDTGLTPGAQETKRWREKSGFESALIRGATKIRRRIEKIEKPLGQLEMIAGAMTGEFPDVEIDKVAAQNLKEAEAILERIIGDSELNKLTPEDKQLAMRVISSLDRIERSGSFWLDRNIPDKTPPKKDQFQVSGTISRTEIPSGTAIKKLPDGKLAVLLNGKIYVIE